MVLRGGIEKPMPWAKNQSFPTTGEGRSNIDRPQGGWVLGVGLSGGFL